MKQVLASFLLRYFRALSKIQLKKINPTIIGITGTAGKTSSSQAIHSVLEDYFSCKISKKANSESGLPLNILGLSPENYSIIEWVKLFLLAPFKLLTNNEHYQYYIAEMAIDGPDEPKNMQYLLTILQPQVGILLNAQPMHSLQFDKLLTSKDPQQRKAEVTHLIAQEKGKLISQLPINGLAVINIDDQEVAEFAAKTTAKLITIGKDKKADIRTISYQPSLKGTSFIYLIKQKKLVITLNNYLLPAHYAYTLASAIAVGNYLNLSVSKIKKSLEKNFSTAPGRTTILKGINQSTIFDSSYNSSAQALIDCLSLMDQVAPQRKIAVIGDIRELGKETAIEYQRVADQLIKVADLVILIGPLMKKYTYPQLKKQAKDVHCFDNTYKAGLWLKKQIKPQDFILIKGSQNTLLLEIIVEMLMQDPKLAEQVLCRRGKFWDIQRQTIINNA